MTNVRMRTAGLAVLAATALGLAACTNDTTQENASESATTAVGTTPAPASATVVSPASERPAAPGPAENFTGTVMVTPLASATDDLNSSAGNVAFEAGARSAWHTHPAGQTLIVTEGVGWVQERGGERYEVRPGDVITTIAGVEHWHGASADSPMTHIAITGVVDGENADWGDLVTDTEYEGR